MNYRVSRRPEALSGVDVSDPLAFPVNLYTAVVYYIMTMADTKRGRERKGRTKQEQRRRHEIQQALEAQDRDLDFDELYEGEELDLEL